ncbi:hypothetical protein LCGC14_0535170 [marine sediment metagenome]|uniref:Uncharacterized protein n=1 Tax=marine sediment metagenome TaxID=412755 RepID=A0A0F9RZ32_9ZZZZ
MGLDVYMSWKGMTKKEEDAQIEGFDVAIGHTGYLRGAYSGHIGLEAIYAFFDGVMLNHHEVKIDQHKIDKIKKNLQKLKSGMFKTQKKEFHPKEQKSYDDFLALLEKKFKEKKNPVVRFSG